jgi:ADP-ribose pyrophosphatase
VDLKTVYQNDKYQVLEGSSNSIFLHQPNPKYATVIAVHEGKVVFVKQYREGIQAISYELPGGGVEQGEDFETAARRELLEETGLKCGKLVPLGEIYNYACMTNRVAQFYFTDDILAKEGQNLDSDEDIEILGYTAEEAFTRIADGRLKDPETAHGLLLARLKGLI